MTTPDILTVPENAGSLAKRGWELLKEGKPKLATEEFRGALRLDSQLNSARVGMIEAIIACRWLNRMMLGYLFWVSTIPFVIRVFLLFGLALFPRLVDSMSRDIPNSKLLLSVPWYLYGAFVFTVWAANPLTYLFLQLNRSGRFVLSSDQRRVALWTGSICLLALVLLCGVMVLPSENKRRLSTLALNVAILLIPISALFACPTGWPRNVLIILTVGMAGVSLAIACLSGVSWYYEYGDKTLNQRSGALMASLFQLNILAAICSSILPSWLSSFKPQQGRLLQ